MDTHREDASSNKTQKVLIWHFQLFISGSYTQNKFSKQESS